MLKQKWRLIARVVYLVDLALTSLAFFAAFFIRDLLLPLVAPGQFPTGLFPLREYLKIYPVVLIIWSVLIVGTGRRAIDVARLVLDHKYWGYKILGFVSDGHRLPNGWARYRVYGTVPEIRSLLERGEFPEIVDEIVFAVTRKKLDEMKQIFLLCEELGIRARVAMNFFQNRLARIEVEELEGIPFLTFTTTPSNETQLAAKRMLDIAVSLMLLGLSLPVIVVAALAIKLTSPGSVVFKQKRIGLNGRTFTLYKFRTMIADAHERLGEVSHLNEMTGPVFKATNDPRITAVGRIMRKFSFDELPQLWNVLKGDMSLVGPRPPIPEEVRSYHRWQRRRLSMKPGLTCLWQVNGRNNVDFDRWMQMDLQYIDNWSPSLDLKILLRTIPAVLLGRGAS